MTENLPHPLVPAEVDIAKLDGFMLDTRRVLSSELLALSSGDEFKAAVTLWCRAWQQRPAASLPNNPTILASFAGVSPQRWAKIKDMALRGFVLCSDGRLYHRVLAEDAMRAWEALTKRHDRTKKATEARKKGRDETRNDDRDDAADDARNAQRDDDRNDQRNEVPTVARDRTGRDGTGRESSTGIVESSAGRPRAPARDEPSPPADGDDPGVSQAVSAIRRSVAEAYERWFDLPDRPLTPADEELLADWINAGTARGLKPAEAADAAAAEVQRQFKRLADRDGGPPRSLRAVLDADVRSAIANARPGRGASGGGSRLPEPPTPYAGHLTAQEFSSWVAPCRVAECDGVVTVEAPTRYVHDWIVANLTDKLRTAWGAQSVEVSVVAKPAQAGGAR
ncbi:DnaA N-terminal domain-containing protein [Azospirillum tabaci]|uniref:DnaA N-terminal domain-containing protein n=1 Tax=Azospirillum tabaci TaxID=2752310 RepID=UPI0016616853|nr:DUF1376 domain-containing protein [Azospirillum tabaci]